MDLSTQEKHFADARRLTRELLHRRYLARTAFSALCVDQAIRAACGQTISTFEKCELRNLSLARKNWEALALLQVAVLREARRALIWARVGLEASFRTSKRA
jgi:hypothetical protein